MSNEENKDLNEELSILDDPDKLLAFFDALEKKYLETEWNFFKDEEINEEKLIETTLPIPGDTLRKYFEDKDLKFVINYSDHLNTKLKDSIFLTYISNIGVRYEIFFNRDIEYSDFSNLIKAYFEQKNLCSSRMLAYIASAIILLKVGMKEEELPFKVEFPIEYLTRFVKENDELLERWVLFIDSIKLYMLGCSNLTEKEKILEEYEVIDDMSYIGLNVANLFKVPEFVLSYEEVDREAKEPVWFEKQFDKYMFASKRLLEFVIQPYSPYFNITQSLMIIKDSSKDENVKRLNPNAVLNAYDVDE